MRNENLVSNNLREKMLRDRRAKDNKMIRQSLELLLKRGIVTPADYQRYIAEVTNGRCEDE